MEQNSEVPKKSKKCKKILIVLCLLLVLFAMLGGVFMQSHLLTDRNATDLQCNTSLIFNASDLQSNTSLIFNATDLQSTTSLIFNEPDLQYTTSLIFNEPDLQSNTSIKSPENLSDSWALFTKDMFPHIYLSRKWEGNQLFAPISVHILSSLLYTQVKNVAERAELAKGTYLENFSIENLKQQYAQFFQSKLMKESFKTMIYVRKNLTEVTQPFLNTSVSSFNALNMSVENITPDILILNEFRLVNRWALPFDGACTAQQSFWTTEAEEKKVKTMQKTHAFNFAYFDSLDANAIEIPFEEKNLSMLIVISKEVKTHLSDLVQKIAKSDILTLSRSMQPKQLQLLLPKFETENERTSVQDIFNKLGMHSFSTTNSSSYDVLEGKNHSRVVNTLEMYVVGRMYLEESGSHDDCKDVLIKNVTETLSCPSTDSTGSVEQFQVNRPFFYFIKDANNIYLIGFVTDPDRYYKCPEL